MADSKLTGTGTGTVKRVREASASLILLFEAKIIRKKIDILSKSSQVDRCFVCHKQIAMYEFFLKELEMLKHLKFDIMKIPSFACYCGPCKKTHAKYALYEAESVMKLQSEWESLISSIEKGKLPDVGEID